MKIISWVKTHKVETIIILLILIIGGFFRFYEIGNFMHFGEDEARDAFMVRSIARDGDIQLLGPSISPGDQAFSLGPLYYYMLVPVYWLSGNSPMSGAVLVAIFSFLSIGLLYYLARLWFGVVAAVTSSFLYSVSWLIIYYGRWVWNPNFVPFFILFLMLCLYYLIKVKSSNKKWWLFGVAISFAIITQLHGTALYILPPLLLFYFLIFRPRVNWKYYLVAFLLILLLYAPLILYDLKNDFANSHGFIKLLTDREPSGLSIWDSIELSYNKYFEFYYEALLHQKIEISFIIVFMSALAVMVNNLIKNVKRKKDYEPSVLILLWLIIPFFVFIFYHDFTPPHYFCMVFPLSFILVGALIQFLFKYKWLRFSIGVVPLVFGSVLIYYSIGMLIDLQPSGNRNGTYQVTFTELEQVRDYVIKDSAGRLFYLKTIPSTAYDRSFEYLFDNEGYQIRNNDPESDYLVVIGHHINIADFISQVDILKSEEFGNVEVLKIKNIH